LRSSYSSCSAIGCSRSICRLRPILVFFHENSLHSHASTASFRMRLMSRERRTNQRKHILLEARWESLSSRHEARVDDVSLGGCFVNTYTNVELGEHIDLEIQLPSGEWLSLQGQVASYQPGVGFGIAFTSLTAKETAGLKELLRTAKERRV